MPIQLKSLLRFLLVTVWVSTTLRFNGCSGEKSALNPNSSPDPLAVASNFITATDARMHIDYLASDALMGRKTPSPGLDSAAEYIARQFRSFGLRAINGSYFHEFNLYRISLGEPNMLKLIKDGREKAYEIKTDYMPFDLTGNNAAEAEVVFVGYGITAPEYDYDDYAGVDVKGKIVLALRHEPQENDSSSVFLGRRVTEHGQLRSKVRNAIQHGAVGFLLMNDPLNHSSMVPRGFPWPSLYKELPDDALPLTLSVSELRKIPVVHIGPVVIEDLLGSVDSVKALEASIDRALHPKSFTISGAKVYVQTTTVATALPTRNVVGFLEGSDRSLEDEIVVVGAHYDHVGWMRSPGAGQDSIFNGADDNASGTTGLLEVAKAFAAGKMRPKRSLLFIAFAGEELGLLGSQAYVRSPSFPLEKTVAMLNMDMIGRNGPDTVSIGGTTRSPDLVAVNERANKQVGMTLMYDIEKDFFRSDQASFAQKKIPVLFYHTGEHEDYHKVSDNPDKIDTEKLSKIARLVFLTAWEIAHSPTKPAYVEPK